MILRFMIKKDSTEIIEFKLANNLRFDENENLPKTNNIGQKTSDIFSEIKYSPNKFQQLNMHSN